MSSSEQKSPFVLSERARVRRDYEQAPDRCPRHGFNTLTSCQPCRRARDFRDGYLTALADHDVPKTAAPFAEHVLSRRTLPL
jgi:hypothetical protein